MHLHRILEYKDNIYSFLQMSAGLVVSCVTLVRDTTYLGRILTWILCKNQKMLATLCLGFSYFFVYMSDFTQN